MSVGQHGKLGSHWKYYHKIFYLRTVRKSIQKIKVYENLAKVESVLHEDLGTFMAVSR
jgi:hypothetical protein